MSEQAKNLPISMMTADRVRRGVAWFLLGIFVAVAMARGANLWWRHERLIVDSQQRAATLAHVLGEHLERTVAGVDAALTQIALHSARIGGPNGLDIYWSPVLDSAFAALAGVGSLTIVNENGLVTHSTIRQIIGQSRADQYLFRRLRDDNSGKVVADTPFRSQLDGHMVIPFGRRLVAPDGAFDGIVVATLEPKRLRNLYHSISQDADAVVSVLHPSGVVLFHEPSDGDQIGKPARDNPLFSTPLDAAGRGVLRAPLAANGDVFLSAVRSISDPPLLLAVSLNEYKMLAPWREEVVVSGLIIGAIALLIVIADLLVRREIRARLAADVALRENRARFYEIMYHAPIFVSVKDAAGRIQFMNRALAEYMGTTVADVGGKTLREIIPNASTELIAALDQEVVETKMPLQRELSYQSARGTHTALFVKFPLLDQEGNVEAIASFSTDLTEQRRVLTLFRTIMEHAPAIIVLKDLDGRLTYVSREFERMLGKPASELLGKTNYDLFPAEYAKVQEAFEKEVLAARAPIQREFIAPYPGGQRTLLFIKFPIFDAKGEIEAIGAIGTDITVRKEIEAQLAKVQRMEAVGQLSGGIAHDFNNLLTVIIGNAELLESELRDNERLHPLAEVTLDAAERSASLTQRLLAFSRRQMLEPKPTDVRRLVEDMEDLIARAAGNQIAVDYRYGDDLGSANIDPAQLETAIVNLVVNARDAMPEGGRITITVSGAEIDDSYARLNPDARPGEYLLIAVSDTGTGMRPDVLARAFEPFFTTKEMGKGTGLGLSMVYGFAKQSGGHVKIYSEIGHGTVVRLYIPRASSPSLVPSLPEKEPEALPGGNESVLLVEDDKFVRAHAESQLAELGYRVTAVAGAEQALKMSRSIGRPDLLLTDVMMPGQVNGRELAKRLRERWPDLKVLFTSGYPDGALPDVVDGAAVGLHFLPKPFRRRDLALKVREALDAEAPVLPGNDDQ
jgi:PAS domain S-box-containing protein